MLHERKLRQERVRPLSIEHELGMAESSRTRHFWYPAMSRETSSPISGRRLEEYKREVDASDVREYLVDQLSSITGVKRREVAQYNDAALYLLASLSSAGMNEVVRNITQNPEITARKSVEESR